MLLKPKLKLRNNKSFSSKFVLQYGIHLGGHLQLLCVETSSIVFGVRTKNIILNLNLTIVELIKVLNTIKGLGFKRTIIYFINSTLNFRLAFKSSFEQYNKHLFFPASIKIRNVLKKFRLLLFSKPELYKIKNAKTLVEKRKLFFLVNGKNLLRKIFVASKWSYGFVSNASTFFSFAHNVLHEKVKFGKMINSFQEKVKSFVDFYPFLPNYGFIGDNRTNHWIVNEFHMAQVPNSSVVDAFSTKALYTMYGITGNSCSIDSTLFFLILTVSNYLLGFYQHVFKFSSKTTLENNLKQDYFLKKKKNYFFKKMKILSFYSK